jgi:hypothetical protein
MLDGASAPVVSLERQQALLLGELRCAAGRPVSFDELRLAGVEYPAGVVSELELAGVGLERCYARTGGGRRAVGVRLDPDRDPVSAPDVGQRHPPETRPVEQSTSWSSPRVYRGSLLPAVAAALLGLPSRISSQVWGALRRVVGAATFWRPAAAPRTEAPDVSDAGAGAVATDGAVDAVPRPVAGRLVALLALVVAAGVLAAVVAVALAPSAGHRHPITARRSEPRLAGSPLKSTPHRMASAERARVAPIPQTAAVPVSQRLATNLEAQGHDLLTAGRYGSAVRVLERAIAATGERPNACVEPTSEVCLTYAYALYDLGRALRLSGQPSVAVPVLERRLEIDNQRPVVAAELALARQQAG